MYLFNAKKVSFVESVMDLHHHTKTFDKLNTYMCFVKFLPMTTDKNEIKHILANIYQLN